MKNVQSGTIRKHLPPDGVAFQSATAHHQSWQCCIIIPLVVLTESFKNLGQTQYHRLQTRFEEPTGGGVTSQSHHTHCRTCTKAQTPFPAQKRNHHFRGSCRGQTRWILVRGIRLIYKSPDFFDTRQKRIVGCEAQEPTSPFYHTPSIRQGPSQQHMKRGYAIQKESLWWWLCLGGQDDPHSSRGPNRDGNPRGDRAFASYIGTCTISHGQEQSTAA
mmetsp:Transcript_17185/g.39833  ORF Transcript_17185/g.39833 Transcript_17185/m.39833 type:complete len:217 (+) Transcript_17185:353-1003(+)